jgi:hypothetical protein
MGFFKLCKFEVDKIIKIIIQDFFKLVKYAN